MTINPTMQQDLDEVVESYVDDLDFQFETLKDRFNAAAPPSNPDAPAIALAHACAVLGKTLFEIKTSPAYLALVERKTAAPAVAEAKPSGMV